MFSQYAKKPMTHEEYESKSQMKRVEILKAGEKTMTHEELLEKELE